MQELIVIAHNIRSTHNVGSIFRTAEGFGVQKIILSGYTPTPKFSGDTRLPHIANKVHDQIHKTALGAEEMVKFEFSEDVSATIDRLKESGYTIVGLEQDQRSIIIPEYKPTEKIALLIGEEVEGITAELRDLCDVLVEIPMKGQKESFNVSVATGIALYALTI